MKIEELQNLLKDTEFVKKLNAAKDELETCELFASNGYNVTVEEIKELFVNLKKQLNEDDLAKVSGGIDTFCIGIGFGEDCTFNGVDTCMIFGW